MIFAVEGPAVFRQPEKQVPPLADQFAAQIDQFGRDDRAVLPLANSTRSPSLQTFYAFIMRIVGILEAVGSRLPI